MNIDELAERTLQTTIHLASTVHQIAHHNDRWCTELDDESVVPAVWILGTNEVSLKGDDALDGGVIDLFTKALPLYGLKVHPRKDADMNDALLITFMDNNSPIPAVTGDL